MIIFKKIAIFARTIQSRFTMNYLVSIIIPVYKVEAYIERCVASIMRQTFHEAPIECILVDDCSPDNSIAIAQHLIDIYRGNIDFKIIKNDRNSGLSVTRNNGMEHATGKYIFFLDSDDDLTEDCMRILLGVVAEHPDVEMVMGNNFYKKRNKPYIDYNEQKVLNNDQLLRAYYQEKIPPIACNSLVFRELIVTNNLSFRPGLIHEDNLWSSKLYPCINKFVYVPQITMIYENNPSSIMNSVALQAAKELPHLIIIMKEFLSSFNEAHAVDYTIYTASFLLRMLDASRVCDKEMRGKVKELRNQLFMHSLKHGRVILASFELWMYNPLNLLFRFKFFRHNFHYIKKATSTVASLFNPLHIHS